MEINGKCILCQHGCSVESDQWRDVKHYNCASCGEFAATEDAEIYHLEPMTQEDKQRIAACTRERGIRGLPKLLLCSEVPMDQASEGAFNVDYILSNMFPSRIEDRFDRALGNLRTLTLHPGQAVRLEEQDALPVTFAESQPAFNFMLEELETRGYISRLQLGKGSRTVVVRGAGFARMQQLEEAEGREQSKQVFVAMWFDNTLYNVYERGIEPAVRDCGFQPLRIDLKEHNCKICDEIIAEIRRSRFLIADFTGCRGGVYFEAGFAKGLGIEVIFMCRDTKEDKKSLHFDTRQYAHIFWDDPEDLQKKLRSRIAATIPGVNTAQGHV